MKKTTKHNLGHIFVISLIIYIEIVIDKIKLLHIQLSNNLNEVF